MTETNRRRIVTRPRRLVPNVQLMELRINNGWSRSDLAFRTGVAEKTIRMAEAGYRPGPRIQFAIAKQFELKPTDLWPLEIGVVA